MKVGYVTLIGRPNVGKSTLLNAIINKKIAITSDKVQTTRNVIEGIYNDEVSQIIFLDTPGIHKSRNGLGRNVNKMATVNINDVDIILFMLPADEEIGKGDKLIIDLFKSSPAKKYCLINKIDKIKNRNLLLEKIAYLNNNYQFDEIIPLSALKKDNISELIKTIQNDLEVGEIIYSPDLLSTNSEDFTICEIIREKILFLTREEIPHSVAVQIEENKDNEDNEREIFANIIVERKSQKGIIIGKNGQMLAKINKLSQRELKKELHQKVYLRLHVKVKEDWRNNKNSLNILGYKI